MLFIFDMDGTVIDSMPGLTKAAVETIASIYGVDPEKAQELYQSTVGMPFAAQLETLFPADKRNREAAHLYERRHFDLSPSFALSAGIEGVMDRLKNLKHKSALVTSTDLDILQWRTPQVVTLPFSFLGGHTSVSSKPTQIQRAIRCFPHEPIVMFGDSLFDKQCAEDIGAQFFMVTPQNVALTVYGYLDGRT